ncbi:hypothetical protein FBQ97_15735 [Acidobacteria bacterium ACD]|nr:MAG: hypothetical protein EDX89_00830 [Acidobacteriota bacterium]MCE7958921.1 hypothetical protein [Acidobacteria bacterium ACB2]MDL1951250.1 hypothetical protein [Acidobacteria bacterium ACD]
MKLGGARSRVAALGTCVAVGVGLASLHFARSVLVKVLGADGVEGVVVSRLTAFALTSTRPALLVGFLFASVVAVVAAEVAVRDGEARLLVHAGVLLVLALALSLALVGLLLPLHVPEVRIP